MKIVFLLVFLAKGGERDIYRHKPLYATTKKLKVKLPHLLNIGNQYVEQKQT